MMAVMKLQGITASAGEVGFPHGLYILDDIHSQKRNRMCIQNRDR